MKYLYSFIGTLLIIALQSIAMSAFCALCKWLYSLCGHCDAPTWIDFIVGAIGFYVILFIYAAVKTAITMYRFHKDPIFMDMNLRVGITWKEYKRFVKNK